MAQALPLLLPLGDAGLLVRFADTLDAEANRRAVSFAQILKRDVPQGAVEIVPNLVSVLVRYDAARTSFAALSGELRLRLSVLAADTAQFASAVHDIPVRYGEEDGPDLVAVAAIAGLSEAAFLAQHASAELQVLAVGFAPGFLYCGFHEDWRDIPRRTEVRPRVPAGTILFAAGQTAMTATALPTGWHVIGRTDFSNFDVKREPPVALTAGNRVRFVQA